ncbi:HYR domain protein [compost metagenome]
MANLVMMLLLSVNTLYAQVCPPGTSPKKVVVLGEPVAVTVSIGNASVTEGTGAGTTSMNFPISTTGGSSNCDITVNYTITHGSTDNSDFTTSLSGVFMIPAGQTAGTLSVGINRDYLVEVNENFTITLSTPSVNAVLGVVSATGTILDDDKVEVGFNVAAAQNPEGTDHGVGTEVLIPSTGASPVQPFNITVSGAVLTQSYTIRLSETPSSGFVRNSNYKYFDGTSFINVPSPIIITIPAGDYTTTPLIIQIPIGIKPDVFCQNDGQLTFTLAKSAVADPIVLGISSAVYTSLDDDLLAWQSGSPFVKKKASCINVGDAEVELHIAGATAYNATWTFPNGSTYVDSSPTTLNATQDGRPILPGLYHVRIQANNGVGKCFLETDIIVPYEDKTNPTITCVSNTTRNTNVGKCDYTVLGNELDATATDNCSGVILTHNLVGAPSNTTLANAILPKGITTITWTAVDASGNSVNCSSTVTVVDNEKPVQPVLADVTGECSATATAPTTTDNCAGVITGTTGDALTYSSQGTHVITWTFADGNGNTTTQTQNVVIKDITAPVQPVLADVTGECSATATAPTTTDNCAGVITGTTGDALTYSSQGTHVITWTFADGNGNTTTQTQNVVIKDITAPVLAGMPSNITQASDAGSCDAVATWTAPTASDNCGVTVTSSHNPGDTFPLGMTTVTYTATDAAGNTDVESFTVTVVNQTPIAVNDNFSGLADDVITGSVAVNDSDPEGAVLTYVVLPNSNLGALVMQSNGVITYTPAAGFTGTEVYSYVVSDPCGLSATANVTFRVDPKVPSNVAPVAVADVYSTIENTQLVINAPGVLSNDTDANSDVLTAIMVSNASNGNVVLNSNGSFTYIPAAGFVGTDSFTYMANDGKVNSNVVTVIINVTASPNVPPTANTIVVNTHENVSVIVDVISHVVDPNNNLDKSSLAIVSGPVNGSFTISPDYRVIYTPDPGFFGQDRFTFRICDLAGACTTADVIVNVDRIQADLAITKVSVGKNIRKDQEFEYVITVNNKGINDETGVKVVDILPSTLEFINASSTKGNFTFDQVTKTINWNVGDVNVNESESITLKVRSTKGGYVTNIASVKGDHYDPDLTNNAATDRRLIFGFTIPNTFTPNGDNVNDLFEIAGIDQFENSIYIYNRWGNEVYKCNNYRNQWDGSQLPEGTYYYVLKVKDKDGHLESYAGYIEILR